MQNKVMKIIAENRYSSVPRVERILRGDDKISRKNIRKVLIGRLLKKQFVKQTNDVDEPNPHHEDFYELTQLGLHHVLRYGIVDNLSKIVAHYPKNIIFPLFFDPYFSRTTLQNATPKLLRQLQFDYFPTMLKAMEDTCHLLNRNPAERRKPSHLNSIRRNIINEIIYMQLIKLTFLIDPETVKVLSNDKIFFAHVSFIKTKIFDPRYAEMVKLKSLT